MTTTQQVNTQDIVESIVAGEYDGDFDRFRDAMKLRGELLGRMKVIDLKVGDRVRFNSHARPKYLQGLEGVVKKKNQASVVVKIEGDAGKFTGSTPRCPIQIVDKIEEEA